MSDEAAIPGVKPRRTRSGRQPEAAEAPDLEGKPYTALSRTGFKALAHQYMETARELDLERRASKKLRASEGYPFWPHETVRNVVIILVFSALCMYLSAFMPYFLEAPADPAGQPAVILPDWYLLWSYGLLKLGNDLAILDGPSGAWVDDWWHVWSSPIRVPVVGAINAKMVGLLLHLPLLLPLLVLPFLHTGKSQRPQEQPFITAVGVWGLAFLFMNSVYAINNVLYLEWPVLGVPVLAEELGWLFQFSQFDLLAWLTWLVPIIFAILTYAGLATYRAWALAAGDRTFKLNRSYHRVR